MAREQIERELAALRARQEQEKRARDVLEQKKKVEEERSMKEMLAKASQLDQDHKAREEAQRREQEEADRRLAEQNKIKELAKEAAQREAQYKTQQEMEVTADRENAAKELKEERNDGGDEEAFGFGGADQVEQMGEYREGYLGMFRGVMKNLKKRWCVLHEDMFMWFRGKQDFIYAGWLTKMGGGTATFGRKNWKRRWMTVRGIRALYSPY